MPHNSFLHFTLTGNFAHFRMRFTTTSPATHLVPPRHTIAGIIGAIMGLERDKIAETFDPSQSKIGIEVLSHLSTIKITSKLLRLKGSPTLETVLGVSDHMIVPFQLVKNPKYRIWFSHENQNIQEQLETLLRNHECVYSPALGLASLLADFSWDGEVETTKLSIKQGMSIQTRSVAPVDFFDPYPMEENHFIIDKHALHLDVSRIPTGFLRVVFDANGNWMEGELHVPTNSDLADLVELIKVPSHGQENVETRDTHVFVW